MLYFAFLPSLHPCAVVPCTSKQQLCRGSGETRDFSGIQKNSCQPALFSLVQPAHGKLLSPATSSPGPAEFWGASSVFQGKRGERGIFLLSATPPAEVSAEVLLWRCVQGCGMLVAVHYSLCWRGSFLSRDEKTQSWVHSILTRAVRAAVLWNRLG